MADLIRTVLNTAYLIYQYPQYLRNQYMHPDQIRKLQEERLRRVVLVAINKVPFYRSLNIKIDANNFTLNDLEKFPVVNKEIIRKDQDQFIRDDINQNKIQWKTTSGSSGKPFGVPKHFYSDAIEGIMGYRAWSMGKDKIYYPRSPALVLRSYSPKENDPIFKHDKIRRYWYLSPYHLNEAFLPEYIRIIEKSNATLLRGYPSSLYIFSLLLKKANIKLPQIKTLICSSESLLPHYRNVIEDYWGIKLMDWYGQNERTVTVQQCWAGNYHNNDDYGYLELGEGNQIIATSVLNDVMPMIRYATGDIATPYEGDKFGCPCGRKLSIPFTSIQGRSDDIIYKDDLTPIPSINFYTGMEPFQKVDQFKLIQQADQSIVLYLVGNGLSEDYVAQIRAQIHQRFGMLPIQIKIVSSIERDTKTDKVKTFQSYFKPPTA